MEIEFKLDQPEHLEKLGFHTSNHPSVSYIGGTIGLNGAKWSLNFLRNVVKAADELEKKLEAKRRDRS